VKNIWDLTAQDSQGRGKVPLGRDGGLKMEKDLQAMMPCPIPYSVDAVNTMILAIGSSCLGV
jgi:hypothetical protein